MPRNRPSLKFWLFYKQAQSEVESDWRLDEDRNTDSLNLDWHLLELS